jgi:uncharacterized membrane protein
MDRNVYMKELTRELKLLSKEEREEVLLYYTEYFEDAGPAREAEAIEELGTPREAASQILKDVAIKRLDKPKSSAKKGLSTIWIVLLAICAAPIGLPLLFAAVVLIVFLVLALLILYICFTLSGALFLGIGVVSIIAGFYVMPLQPANAAAMIGLALLELGGGLLILLAGILCCRFIYRVIRKWIKRLLSGGEKHE